MSHAECDVVVIGAGISGLAATHHLVRDARRRVLCVEARDRVGGRALSVDTGSGPADLGATWWWANEPAVRELVEELQVPVFDQYREGDAVVELVDGDVRRIDGNPWEPPAFRFRDGAQDLAQRMADTLPEGVLRLDSPVSAVTVNDGGALVRVAAGTEIETAAVILAVPPALAVSTIDVSPPLDASLVDVARTTAVWMGDMVKAVATYATPFWRSGGMAGSAMSQRGPFREFHDMSVPGRGGAIFAFAPAVPCEGLLDEELRSRFIDQVARLFGPEGGLPLSVHVKNWRADPWTAPGRRLDAGEATTATYGHRVFQPAAHGGSGTIRWASTETDTAFPGHLEGAIRAGIRAARSVAEGRADD
ncbi:MAG TPA: NAD(P)/FAD-dependent oxidoreductase [Flexivirga sp.]|uniref:flavin monoamine oxidase family protein n=1 Tax=Flexivirga sp. TaxID=1962927 RepID=UPI002C431F99|nr:NAD(P)/FAD-dependent oxidoreductase [Flexivirga sp.]HWC24155.1 NAD(P)/FAD-dependent oxidoreductase [Flexivirga sp.]